jgi:hypothetical protein
MGQALVMLLHYRGLGVLRNDILEVYMDARGMNQRIHHFLSDVHGCCQQSTVGMEMGKMLAVRECLRCWKH